MHFICVRTTLVAAVNGHVYDLVSVSLVCLLQPLRLRPSFVFSSTFVKGIFVTSRLSLIFFYEGCSLWWAISGLYHNR